MNKYSVLVLFFLLHLASIFSIFPEKIIGVTSQGHWEAILLGGLAELLILWVYLKVLAKFPGKTIMDVFNATAGKWGARLILLPFLLFLFFHLILQTHYQTDEVKAVLLPETPEYATLFILMTLTFYAAWKGIFVIVRAGVALLLLFMPFILFSIFICMRNFDYRYAFPIWDGNFSFLMQPQYYVSLLTYSGFLFLGLIALKKPIGFRQAVPVMLSMMGFALISVYIPLMVFGQETVNTMRYPTLMSSDTIDLEWVVFDWLPTFYVVSTSAISILQASVLIWMAMSMIQKLYIPVKKNIWIAAGICMVAYILSLRIPNVRTMDQYYALNSMFCLYSVIGIPLIAALLVRLRKKKVST